MPDSKTYEQKKQEFAERFYNILENFEGIYENYNPNISWSSESERPEINDGLMENLPDEKKEAIQELIESLFPPNSPNT